jgi:type IV pilus assembly protein PilQ
MAFSIFNPTLSRLLNIEISALESEGKSKVISSPHIVTADQSKAVIEQGTELPYLVDSGDGVTSIQFRKAILKLEVTPRITPQGKIVLDLDISKDNVGRLTSAGYAIETKHIATRVRVENGGTAAIGGIYEETNRKQTDSIPLVGDLPLVGRLFRRTQNVLDNAELMVLVTPRLVSDRGEWH